MDHPRRHSDYDYAGRSAPAEEDQGEFVAMVHTSQAAAELLPQADPELELSLDEEPRREAALLRRLGRHGNCRQHEIHRFTHLLVGE